MSIRLSDPAGELWIVRRQWFGAPPWLRKRIDVDHAIDPAQAIPYFAVGDSLAGFLALSGLFIVLVVAVVLAIALVLFLQLVLILAGLVVALAVVAARLLHLASWSVEARSPRAVLVWRVRGMLRSARAVREVAAALGRGDEPLIDGIRPRVVDNARV